MAHTPLCYICREKLKKKGSVLTADIYKTYLEQHLQENDGNVEKLTAGSVSGVVNTVTMQYFSQFDLFCSENRDDTLQLDWIMNPPRRFGIVFPRIPEDKCLFILAHEECIQKSDPVYSISVGDIVKIKKGVSLTLEMAGQKWFNKRGWLHMCTDLYGEKGAAEIEHRSLL